MPDAQPPAVEIEEHPEFAAAQSKRRELSERKSRLQDRIHELEHLLWERRSGDHRMSASRGELEAEAGELVGECDEEAKGVAQKQSEVAKLSDELRTARRDLEITQLAIQRLLDPGGPWKRAQIAASCEACQKLAGEHRRRALEIARAAVRLLKASEAEYELREELARRELRVTAPIFTATFIPDEQLRHRVVHYLTELDRSLPGIKAEALDAEGYEGKL